MYQTVWTLIRLLLMEQSYQSPNCLHQLKLQIIAAYVIFSCSEMTTYRQNILYFEVRRMDIVFLIPESTRNVKLIRFLTESFAMICISSHFVTGHFQNLDKKYAMNSGDIVQSHSRFTWHQCRSTDRWYHQYGGIWKEGCYYRQVRIDTLLRTSW